MQEWIPPAISGLFSIVVVVIGALFVRWNDNRNRAAEHARESNKSQRTAVADYIKALRTATTKWEKDRAQAARIPDESAMKSKWWEALDQCFTSYRDAGTDLDIELTNPAVRKAFLELDNLFRERHEHYATVLTFNSVESWSELNLAKPSYQATISAVDHLAAVARENLNG